MRSWQVRANVQPEDAGMPQESVFSGVVSHSRRYDIEHSFSYPVWMVMALMSGEAAASGRVLSRWLRPRAEKYLTREKVEALVGEALDNARDTVWLLTQPSLVGRSFNPVSFYFVIRGDEIRWIIAHITNTPWDESHCYVLPQQGETVGSSTRSFTSLPSCRWNCAMTGNSALAQITLRSI